MRLPGGVDEAERLRNRTKSRTRARVEHPFLVLKRLWGFAKVRYRGLAKNANRAFTAKAMVNLYLAARRTPALVRPSLARTRFKAPEPPLDGQQWLNSRCYSAALHQRSSLRGLDQRILRQSNEKNRSCVGSPRIRYSGDSRRIHNDRHA